MPRVHLIIRGNVQGVFFRQGAADLAERLGLTGWVRNRADGAVEIVAEGSPDALQRLRAWSTRGPRGAEVDSVDEVDESATGEFEEFRIR
jgi:acylphosphatase